MGDVIATVYNKDDKKLNKVTLSGVTYSPQARFNLFSISLMMEKGWLLSGNNDCIKLKKGNQELVFDVKVETPKGVLYCIKMKRDAAAETITVNIEKKKKNVGKPTMSLAKVCKIMGHINNEMMKKVFKYLNIKITKETATTCNSCAVAKMKRRELKREKNNNKTTALYQQMYLNMYYLST